uniref:RRM domain-containing protein n=1 Tax=Neobodo designis TaxID=312471 RepID=A0A7S1LG01_NEODS|mmetsp:Transcript_2019/g.6317  ORF Transcript_2019/g.6317 Transcript_2019/m.6317 type:complete len:330 (+) Transcript_2019:906-1895(+)
MSSTQTFAPADSKHAGSNAARAPVPQTNGATTSFTAGANGTNGAGFAPNGWPAGFPPAAGFGNPYAMMPPFGAMPYAGGAFPGVPPMTATGAFPPAPMPYAGSGANGSATSPFPQPSAPVPPAMWPGMAGFMPLSAFNGAGALPGGGGAGPTSTVNAASRPSPTPTPTTSNGTGAQTHSGNSQTDGDNSNSSSGDNGAATTRGSHSRSGGRHSSVNGSASGRHFDMSASNTAVAEQRQLIVKFLTDDTSERQFRTLFEQHGPVENARIIYDRKTGHTKGFGFITYAHPADAVKALRTMGGYPLHGRQLNVALVQTERRRAFAAHEFAAE